MFRFCSGILEAGFLTAIFICEIFADEKTFMGFLNSNESKGFSMSFLHAINFCNIGRKN
jgi:hypothetical protein